MTIGFHRVRGALCRGSALPALALLGAGLLAASPALAQDAVPPQSGSPTAPDAATPGKAAVQLQSDQPQQEAQADAGQDIVVTGTLFRRTDTETPSPVSVITATNLEQRGLSTVADAIQTISAGNGGSVPQGFLNAFASGAQGVSLRGLTTNSTLVLFDGLRPAYYPLADDGQRSFVDINTIPSAIVDRIETLRDGASSTYGADAVGGVVNVILKREITGIQGRVEAGTSQRGDIGQQRVSLTAGYGNLAERGWNLYVSGEYYHSDPLRARDRGFPYNTNNLSSITRPDGFTGANGNVGFLPPATTNSSSTIVAVVRPATQATPGNILSGVPIAGGQYQVIGQGGCAAANLINRTSTSGNYCEQDLVNAYTQLQPELNRYGGTAHLTVNVGDKAQAYAVGTFYESDVYIQSAPATLRSVNPLYTLGLILPARLSNGQLNPQNPYAASGQGALLFYLFGDIPNSTLNKSKTYRAAAGIDGKFGADDAWAYSLNGTYMRTDLTQTRQGFINVAGLTNAINTGSYNFINPSANTQAVRDSISPTQQSRAHSEVAEVQATVTRALFDLPGGPLNVGVGGEFRYENIYDPNPNPGNAFLTINPFAAIGHRYIESAFFEVNAPVFDKLEVNGSGRYDHYSIGFDNFSPKIGAKFSPIRQIAIRGTYSRGFRAPSVPETSGNVIGFTTYTPPANIAAQHNGNSYVLPYSVGLNSVGNPDLKPEKSRSFTGGIVVQPVPWLSLTVDYYNIRKTDVIYQTSDTSYANDYLNGVALPAGITITPNAPDPEFPNLRPTPLFVNGAYANGQRLQTSGIDFQVSASIPFRGAKFSSSLEATEILEYKQYLADGTVYDYLGTLGSYSVTSASGTPRWRATWQNTVEAGPYSLTATGYYTSGYKGYAADYAGIGDCGAGLTPESSVRYNAGLTGRTLGPALQCTVKHFLSFDVQGAVKVNDNFSLYLNIYNIADAKAPFDPNTYGGNNYNPAWSASGVIGRYFKAGATFKF